MKYYYPLADCESLESNRFKLLPSKQLTDRLAAMTMRDEFKVFKIPNYEASFQSEYLPLFDYAYMNDRSRKSGLPMARCQKVIKQGFLKANKA